jgi:PAS domain S-box-containing protein
MPQGSPDDGANGEPRSPSDPIEAARRLADRLRTEVEELRLRLAEAEETIRAIREGEVDAFVVAGPESDRVFTLETAEHPYRRLVEAMHQAAVTVAADGTILYANNAFTRAAGRAGGQVLGRSIAQFFAAASRSAVADVLARDAGGRGDALLLRADGSLLPVRISASDFPDEEGVLSLILTDLTDQGVWRRWWRPRRCLDRSWSRRWTRWWWGTRGGRSFAPGRRRVGCAGESRWGCRSGRRSLFGGGATRGRPGSRCRCRG